MPRARTFLPWLVTVVCYTGVRADVPVEVHTLDGGNFQGQVTAWNSAGIRLQGTGGAQQTLDFNGLLRVDVTRATQSPESSTELKLIDGSTIRAEQIVMDRTMATASVRLQPQSENAEWTFASSAVQWARLRSADDVEPVERRDLQRRWSEVCQQQAAADVLVVRKPGSLTLQPIEGAIGEITDSTVQFTLGDEVVDVNRDRVHGVIFYHAALADVGDAIAVDTIHGHRLVGDRVVLVDGELQVRRGVSDAISLPLEIVASVDYSPGRLAFLSDLDPFRIDVTPPIVEPDGAVLTWWHPRRDQSFSGSGLALAFPAAEDQTHGLPRLQSYAKGLAVRGPATVVYRLPSGYRRVVATVGVDPELRHGAPAEWVFRAGERVLDRGVVDRQAPPAEMEFDIEDIREITLEVYAAEPAGGPVLPHSPIVQFCNARLLK